LITTEKGKSKQAVLESKFQTEKVARDPTTEVMKSILKA
jgi:hypothetical protein